jgi:hypothetical protein
MCILKFFSIIQTKMPYLLRRNNWAWGKPCTCCRQFTIDQAKKEDTRAKRAARRATSPMATSPPPQNPPPETIQETTVPTLRSIITRQMTRYYGYGYFS